MALKKRAKPKDPQQIAAEKRARAFHAVGLQVAASVLPANADVEAEDKQRDHDARARRLDAFDALRDGMDKGAYDAARKLERDIVTSRGEHDKGRSYDRVDNDKPKDRMDTMITASKAVDAVMTKIGPRDQWLLTELISPSPAIRLSTNTWRQIVAHITGEENPHAQAAAVRSACANLAAAYEQMLEAA